MTEHLRESDLVAQRRANFEELVRLGVDPYPRSFARTHTVSELVTTFGGRSGAELEAERIHSRAAGRILAIRSFARRSSWRFRTGSRRFRSYLKQDALSERDFAIAEAPRFWRLRRG
jgi:lysyl-tRNA synthetase class 2